MKKILTVIFIIATIFSIALFSSCAAFPSSGGIGGDGGQTTSPDGENGGDESGGYTEDGTGGDNDGESEISVMYVYVNGNKLEVTLEKNSAVDELVALLRKGNITYTAHANGFEIYGDIGHSLPTSDSYITSQTGDVLLWAASNICIFFGNNSYSYTRIGAINGYSASQLKALLGAGGGSVQVTLSLN